MKDLNYFKEKIKEKRKTTNFQNYIKEIASWTPIVFHKNNWMISRFPESDRIWGVIHSDDFDEKNTDIFYSGLDYNENIDFFDNYLQLQKSVVLSNMINFFASENSQYADVVNKSKNAYLSAIVIFECENILYSLSVKDNSVNVYNSMMVNVNNENIYSSVWIVKSFKVFYSKYINNSSNIWFSNNLIWCSECILCSDLENASYCIENTKYEKQEYLTKKAEILKEKESFEKIYLDMKVKGKNMVSTNINW